MTCITHYRYKRHDRDIIVYRALFPNNKSYIGITSTSLERRKYDHLNKARKGQGHKFHKAIAKYGEPQWEILAVVKTVEKACELEKKYIIEFGTFGANGYNLTSGGDIHTSYSPITEQTRRKMSESHIGKKWTEEHRVNFSKSIRGSRMLNGRRVERICMESGEVKVYERSIDTEKDGFITDVSLLHAINVEKHIKNTFGIGKRRVTNGTNSYGLAPISPACDIGSTQSQHRCKTRPTDESCQR